MVRSTRKEKWQFMQTVCSLQPLVEKPESTDDMITISSKFLRILKSSFKAMNTDYKNDITEAQENIINALEVKMNNAFHYIINLKESRLDDCVSLALSYLYISYIYIDKRAKIHNSKNYLTKSLELLKGNELDCKAILIAMRVLNELSYIELIIENITESQTHLNKALQLYLIFTKEKDDYPVPIDVASILSIEDKISCKCLLERIYLTTLEGLLELDDIIYPNPEHTDVPEAVIHMHEVLNKELNMTNIDYVEWAANSVELSTYFAKYGRFTEARNHLAAATFMVQQFFADTCLQTEEHNYSIVDNISQTRYSYASAITAMYWAKYGLALMKSSRERAIIKEGNKLSEADNSQSSKSECSTKSEMQVKDLLIFPNIEKDLTEFTAPITNKCPLNYEEAKKVFVSVLNWFNDAKIYITKANITDKAVDQFSIAIGVSTAYRYLAYYEQDRSKKIKLYKRQIDVLDKVIETCTPKVGTKIYKELYIELIFSYSTIVDIMTEHLRADKSELTENELVEVKQYAKNCLKNLKKYLTSPDA